MGAVLWQGQETQAMEVNDRRAEGDSQAYGQTEDELMLGEAADPGAAPEELRIAQFCLDSAADAIFWMQADARFTYVNETACRSLGYSREELLSMTVHDIDPNFPKEVWAEHWGQLRRQGSFTIESLHRAKDGRTYPVEITVNYLKYGAKEYNCAFARDVTERKRAEELIRVSEQRYRTLAENIGLGIAHVDIDHNIVIVNSAVGKMFQSDPSEFVGKKCYDVFEKAKGICSNCPGDEAIRTGRPAETEGEGVRRDGSRFPVRIQAFPLFAEDGEPTGFIEVAEDITERKRSEEEIEKFFNMTGYMICIASIDGYFTRINESFEQTLGYSSEELLSRPYLDFVHPDDRKKTTAVVEEKLAVGARVVGFENRYRCKDGSYKWLSWVSHPVVEKGITYAIAYDITDRKQVKEALRSSQDLLARTQQIAQVGSWQFDVLEKKLTWSAETYRIFGVIDKTCEPTYESFLKSVHPKDRAKVEQAYSSSLLDGEDTYEIEHRLIKENSGEVRHVLEKCQHERDESGAVIRSIGMVQDITERKLNEKALLAATRSAKAANQSKGLFLAKVSHEIRTPMTAIIGFSELLEDANLTPDERMYLEAIQSSTSNLSSLLQDILDLSKVDAGELVIKQKDFNLHKLINELVSTQKMQIEVKKLSFNLSVDNNVPEVLIGDPLRIQQVLLNLLNNAIKFTEKGEISVAVTVTEETGHWVMLDIAVRDSGVGISKSKQKQIFEPFAQVHADSTHHYGGSGLGLTISRSLADLMGGSLRVESQEEVGSTFHLIVPMQRLNGNKSEKFTTEREQLAWKGPPLKILLAEDNTVNSVFIETVLKNLGHTVTVAENGRIALDTLKMNNFDVALMDIQMPFISGIDVLGVIRKMEEISGKHLNVIALTAYSLIGDQEKYLEMGFDGYLSKPFKQKELIDQLARVALD